MIELNKIKETSEDIRAKYRIWAISFMFLSVAAILAVVGIIDIQGNTIVAVVELFVMLTLLIFAYYIWNEKKYIDQIVYVSIVMVGVMLMYNTTLLLPDDASALMGLVIMPFSIAIITIKKHDYLYLSGIIYLMFLLLSLFNMFETSTSVLLKTHLIFIFSVVFVSIFKNYLHEQSKRLFAYEKEADKIFTYKQKLDLALRAGDIGIWEWNVNDDIMEVDETIYAKYKIPYDAILNMDTFKSYLQTEDAILLEKNISRVLMDGDEFDIDLHIVVNDETYIVDTHIMAVKDKETDATKIIGITNDITERVKARQELQKNQR